MSNQTELSITERIHQLLTSNKSDDEIAPYIFGLDTDSDSDDECDTSLLTTPFHRHKLFEHHIVCRVTLRADDWFPINFSTITPAQTEALYRRGNHYLHLHNFSLYYYTSPVSEAKYFSKYINTHCFKLRCYAVMKARNLYCKPNLTDEYNILKKKAKSFTFNSMSMQSTTEYMYMTRDPNRFSKFDILEKQSKSTPSYLSRSTREDIIQYLSTDSKLQAEETKQFQTIRYVYDIRLDNEGRRTNCISSRLSNSKFHSGQNITECIDPESGSFMGFIIEEEHKFEPPNALSKTYMEGNAKNSLLRFMSEMMNPKVLNTFNLDDLDLDLD